MPAPDLILRLQLVPHFEIRMHFCLQRTHLGVPFEYPTLSISFAPGSVPFRLPLDFAFTTIEHPIPQSFLLAPCEDVRTFDPLLRNDVQVAFRVALLITGHRSLLAWTSNLSLFPQHLVRLGELGKILVGIAQALGPSVVCIFYLLHAVQLPLLCISPRTRHLGGDILECPTSLHSMHLWSTP